MNERAEQIKAVMADEAFVKACIAAENEEAVQKLFADKGIEMSLSDIEVMGEMINAFADDQVTEEELEMLTSSGELSDEALEAVSGGLWTTTFSERHPQLIKNMKKVAPVITSTIFITSVTYGICKACGVNVEGGIKKGYNWVADKVTSRW